MKARTLYILSQSYAENKGSFLGVIEHFARYAHDQGYRVIIICGRTDKKEPKYQKLPYAKVIRFPTIKAPFFRNMINALILARYVKSYFKRHPASANDLFYANGEAALGILNKKFVLRAGDQPAFTYWKNVKVARKETPLYSRIARFAHLCFQYIIEKRCIKKASGIVYASLENKYVFNKSHGGKNKPYFIPRSGIQYSRFENGKKLFKKQRIIMFTALYNERLRKGVMYLERALPEIFAKHDDVRLIHVGEKFAWNLPDWCKKRIISTGKVPWEKMKDYYASADVLVSCSLSEGFPNALLEAMAAGIPVVTSDIQGIHEYIAHKKEGYIFKKGNINDLKKGILYMLENPTIRKKTGKAVCSRFKSIESEKYYKNLLQFLSDSRYRTKKNINLLRR